MSRGSDIRRGALAAMWRWLDERSALKVFGVTVVTLVVFGWTAKAAWDSKADASALEEHERWSRQAKINTDQKAAEASERIGQLGAIVADDHEKLGYLSEVLFRMAISRGLQVPPPPAGHQAATSAASAINASGPPLRPLFTSTRGP